MRDKIEREQRRARRLASARAYLQKTFRLLRIRKKHRQLAR